MSTNPKPSSKSSIFTFILLLLLLLLSFLSIAAYSSSDANVEANEAGSGEESDDLEQLLAVDEQLQEDRPPEQQSEAESVSKAQRIVLELSGDNTKRVIDGNEFVMILGYAPWCARSADLMPRFSEAATALKEIGSPILMAKIDGDRYSKVASELEIKGFPTLLLFVNGTSQPYTGGFSAEDIVIWVQKKTGAPIITVNTVDEAQRFLNKYHTFVVGLFNKFEGSEYNEFVKAAKSDDEIQFVETSNIDVAKLLFPDLKTENVFIGMVKTEAERYTTYDGSYEMDKILEFLGNSKFPLITRLTESNTVWVYSSPVKLQVMVFAKADDFQNLAQPLEDLARKFKSKLMFINVDITNENLAMPFLTLFGIVDANKTVVAAFDNNLKSKYLLESDPSPSKIEDFCSGLADGTVSRYYRSEPVPDNKNASVVNVVGKTFDELVLNSRENVLLEVHTPWCVNCEALSKQVEKLAKHFKGFENLVFARIDASANEHTNLQVDDEYPMILLHKSGEKEKPVKLSTKSSAKDMAVFINEELRPKDVSAKDEL